LKAKEERMISKLYIDKKKRDEEFKLLKAIGYNVRKSSSRNQLIHPMYIEDYPYSIDETQKGFGNNIYKTYFPVLYSIIEESFY